MKKIIVPLIIMAYQTALLSAHINFENITEKNIIIHDDSPSYTKDLNDDYEIGTVSEMEDYEQQICDTAQNPKVSSMQARIIAAFDSIIGSLLVKMIVMKEVARYYLTELKQTVSSWMKQ